VFVFLEFESIDDAQESPRRLVDSGVLEHAEWTVVPTPIGSGDVSSSLSTLSSQSADVARAGFEGPHVAQLGRRPAGRPWSSEYPPRSPCDEPALGP
jgi:hypothetical protein